jgi:hypothetical protein
MGNLTFFWHLVILFALFILASSLDYNSLAGAL